MILHRGMIALMAFCVVGAEQNAGGAEPPIRSYSLAETLELALKHSPLINGAEAALEESHGRQVAAGAYLNPTVSGSSGRGSIRDPRTGVSIVERTISVEQPLEWPGKRMARQRAADAELSGALAGREEIRVTVAAEVKSGVLSTPLCPTGCAVGQGESTDGRGLRQSHSGESRDEGVAEV